MYIHLYFVETRQIFPPFASLAHTKFTLVLVLLIAKIVVLSLSPKSLGGASLNRCH